MIFYYDHLESIVHFKIIISPQLNFRSRPCFGCRFPEVVILSGGGRFFISGLGDITHFLGALCKKEHKKEGEHTAKGGATSEKDKEATNQRAARNSTQAHHKQHTIRSLFLRKLGKVSFCGMPMGWRGV